jgi:apolipoprotein N-acyltransferase
MARFAPLRRALGYGYLAGFVFWLLSLRWLTHVTVLGWIGLCAYCALFLIPVVRAAHRWHGGAFGFAASTAVVWSGFEFLRGWIFGGFPWNPLGAGVAPWLPAVQTAEFGGVWLVSALVVFVNALLAWAVVERRDWLGVSLGLGLVVLALGWGAVRVARLEEPSRVIRLSVVQPAIPQDEKWVESKTKLIYSRLRQLTQEAQRDPWTELVIWPETALPDDVRHSERSYAVVSALAKKGRIPILTGTLDTVVLDTGVEHYFNSAFLFDPQARLAGEYDKRHLVVFGEFIPLSRWIPETWRRRLRLPLSITKGRESAVFRVGLEDVPFSPLICFEDILPHLARADVSSGARMLVNLTNDAWFDEHIAPRQHMRNAVLRAVENRVPLVRAANTGVSCMIEPSGRIASILHDGEGRTWMPGVLWAKVAVPPDSTPLTFYTRYGDMYGIACAVAALLWLVASLRHVRRIRSMGGL